MKLTLPTLIAISRPRFWLYLAGPFLIGYISGVENLSSFLSVQFWLYFFYFLLPANIFLYGINDLADTDTDQFNIKKKGYEHELQTQQQRPLLSIVVVCAVLTVLISVLAEQLILGILLMLLLLLSFAYSFPPFRWKSKPLIDSASNILYIIPGIFGFYLMSGTLPALGIVFTGWLWTAAMHLFSAVPDIEADSRSNLHTTAVTLGLTKSILLCSGLWWLSMISAFLTTGSVFTLLLGVYGVLPLLCLTTRWSVEKMYRIFPVVNAVMGFGLFWLIAVHRFL